MNKQSLNFVTCGNPDPEKPQVKGPVPNLQYRIQMEHCTRCQDIQTQGIAEHTTLRVAFARKQNSTTQGVKVLTIS